MRKSINSFDIRKYVTFKYFRFLAQLSSKDRKKHRELNDSCIFIYAYVFISS